MTVGSWCVACSGVMLFVQTFRNALAHKYTVRVIALILPTPADKVIQTNITLILYPQQKPIEQIIR